MKHLSLIKHICCIVITETTHTPVTLLRSPEGEMLSGFARDFLRESLRTTMRFPQSQAVIQIAVAVELLRAIASGYPQEIIELFNDLKSGAPKTINIPAISDFVTKHYDKLGFNFPKVADEKYLDIFKYEIFCGLKTISRLGGYYFHGQDAERCVKAAKIIPENDNSGMEQYIPALTKELSGLSPEFCQELSKVFSSALKTMQQHPESPVLLKALINGIKTRPRGEWRMRVMFPYSSRLSKLADSAISEAAKASDYPFKKTNPFDSLLNDLKTSSLPENPHKNAD